MVAALIQFEQGAPGTAGQAFLGALSSLVSVTNADNTDVSSWTVELLESPPGSGLVPGLLSSASNNTPTAAFSPDVIGSYRIKLTVSDGSNTDYDIRVFSVPDSRGVIYPPYQDPDIARPPGKPDELNFSGQARGWMGDSSSKMMYHLLKRTVEGPATSTENSLLAWSNDEGSRAQGTSITVQGDNLNLAAAGSYLIDGARVAGPHVGLSISGNTALDIDSWAGADPKSVPLVLYVGVGADITLPGDASRTAGTRIRVIKTGSASYTVNILRNASLINGASSDYALPTSGTQALTFECDGSDWLIHGGGGISVSGFSILAKTDTGDGTAESLIISEGHLAGRPTGQNLGSYSPNTFDFVNSEVNGGNPTLKVSAESTSQVSALSSSANSNFDSTLSTDGYYEFTVRAVLRRASTGDYRRVSAVVDGLRSGGTLTLEGSPTSLPGGTATGVILTLSTDGSGNLRANISNDTGETLNGYIQFGWLRSDLVP